MPVVEAPVKPRERKPAPVAVQCYHCGETCDNTIIEDDRVFCCDGCKFVYGLLKENGLCNYYDLSNTPGIKVKGKYNSEKFAFLETVEARQKLITFSDEKQSQVSFYLPQMHCISCIWLLENLHAIQPGILFSKTNFHRKQIFIVFNHAETSLRKVVELLAFIGYEPYISLNEGEAKKEKKVSRKQFYKIGVACFCFSNIMMLSFPEYFSSGDIAEGTLKNLFTWLNLFLALPVFFYSASDFFVSAWKGLRQKWLNIDAPIALSIMITFSRSIYEVFSGTGAGYFDSMSGIVLFMLAGRWFQNKTYDSFSFDRDYKSYFPLGITKLVEGNEVPATISSLQKGDHIMVRHGEMVPADSVLLAGEGSIDYSFVSGENTPVLKKKGELIYAGAKQLGGSIVLQVIKTVNQSYITQLWNNNDFFASHKNGEKSFIHPLSRYFTVVLFTLCATAGVYWAFVNPANILPAISASLIVACPCMLLLSATFTFGNMLRYYGRNKLYLKNATVIESLAKINHVVFDKTGTLTYTSSADIEFIGGILSREDKRAVYSLVNESAHPLSRLVKDFLLRKGVDATFPVTGYKELAGKGTEALVSDRRLRIGSCFFVAGYQEKKGTSAEVWVSIDGNVKGYFCIHNLYRDGVEKMVTNLEKESFKLHLLSGDNSAEKEKLQSFFGKKTPMLFGQSPQDKLEYIKGLKQDSAANVLMLGDGLNDAGALKQSNVGIAVTENTSQFTPASDGILDSSFVKKLPAFISYAKAGKRIVMASWMLSFLYNTAGLSIAMQAEMSPMVAAILMPMTSITIVTFSSVATSIAAKRRGL